MITRCWFRSAPARLIENASLSRPFMGAGEQDASFGASADWHLAPALPTYWES